MVGWRATFDVWPALAVSGLSFALVQFYWSNYQESGLVDIIAALLSLLAMVAFLKVWQPKASVEKHGELALQAEETALIDSTRHHSITVILKGWSPFLLASVLIFVWSVPAIKDRLTLATLKQPMPYLDHAVIRIPPVVPKPVPEEAIADLNFVVLPGTAVFLAGALAALLLGMNPAGIIRTFARTVIQLTPSLTAISFMVSLAYVTRYSGMDTVLESLSLTTRTGPAFPFFGTLLGWLGVALTGTDAGSNVLFGNLQKVTAERLGISPILMASANSSGGVMGKMIDAQSIVVSSAATGQAGREAEIFKVVFKHSVALACLVGLIVTFYAFVVPWVIPLSTP